MIRFKNAEYLCASEITLGLVSGKWKILILSYLSENTFRFGELRKRMPGATQKTLTSQLRDLENDGLIVRKVYPVVPPKVEYFLTDLGRELVPMLKMLCDYGADYVDRYREPEPSERRFEDVSIQ